MNVERILILLGKLPTTQFNCLVAATAILSTTARYVSSHDKVLSTGVVTAHWVPDSGWLWFLLALAGVNTAHYIGKRMTDTGYVKAKNGAEEELDEGVAVKPT